MSNKNSNLQFRPALTPEEVASVIRVHPTYCRDLFTKGMIPGAIRIGAKWVLPADAMDQILKNGINTQKKKRLLLNDDNSFDSLNDIKDV